jgi:trigger factor
LTELENSGKQLEFSLNYEELKPHFEKAIVDYSKKAVLPGFRKGKAPISMIKKRVGDSLEYSSLEDITNEVFWDYLTKSEEKFDIVGRPVIRDIDYKPKETLTFKVEFEVMPRLDNITYRGLELERTKYEIDDSMIEDEIRYHRFRNAQHEIDGQALDNEYIITVDLQNLDDAGNVIIGESQKGMTVYLGNDQIYPEFREAFKGIREGETKVIESKNAEGNPKKVQATCTKVEKLVFPEMTADFFKTVTGKEGLNTEEEFRAEIKNELQNIYESIAKRKFQEDVIAEVIKMNDIMTPEVFVETVLDSLLEDYAAQFKGHTLPEDFDKATFRKERRADAIRSAKWYLIRQKISEIENIKVADEDYSKLAETESQRYGIPAEKLIDAFKADENMNFRLLTDKVIDFVIANATVKERIEKKTAPAVS